MATTPEKPKLLAIVGPTASGKTELALELSRLTPIEIICADSRTIYKDMNLGTAKASASEQRQVKQWGLDLIQPGQAFSAHDFQVYAKAKITEITKRGHLPVLVGGSGLYVDSVLYNFEFTSAASESRSELERMTVEELHKLIVDSGYPIPENKLNKRHLVRTIEREGNQGSRSSLDKKTQIIGLIPSDETLRNNINIRAEKMFDSGVLAETKSLVNQYGEAALLATGGIVYKICTRVINGEISEQTATTLNKTADWQYARRQKSWFKKNNDIRWFTDRDKVLEYFKSILNT